MQSLWMLLAAFMFSLMSVGVKFASETYAIVELVMYRSLVSAVVTAVIIFVRGGTLRTRYPIEHFWRAAIGATAFGLWFYAMSKLPIATAMTLNYMSPIWLAAMLFGISLWQGKSRFEWGLVLAVATSFVGVALLLRPAIQADQLLWGLYGLVSGIMAAMVYLQVRRLGQLGEPEDRVVFYFGAYGTVGGALACIIRAWLPESDGIIWHAHDWNSLMYIMVIGVCAAIGQIAMTRAYQLGKTLVTANLQYTGIIFSSIWGILIWDDKLGWLGWLGMAMIIASGIAATFFDVRNKPVAACIRESQEKNQS